MVDRLAELGALQYAAANTATASVNPSRIAASGYIHAMYAEYVTWSLANPGVNPSRLSAKGRIFGYFYDNATFSPLSLFAASEVGVWYDPSDLTTMFQDSAGTTPVTADGQPVGKILDKSGRGNHASQATAASRPLYKTDGTYHWLQFDGVDDSLITAAINFTSTDKASLFAGVRKVGTSTGVISELSASADTEVGSFVFYGNDTEYGVYSGGTNGTNGKRVFTFTSPITNVVTFEMDRSIAGSGTGVKTYRVNGAVPSFGGVGSTALAAGGNFGTWPIYIGQRGGSAYSFNGNIYSLIVRGALSTTQEITDTETWVNSKTGAY